MPRKRKYNTEEERKEANRLACAKYRANRTPEQEANDKERKRVAWAKYRANRTPEQKAERKEKQRLGKAKQYDKIRNKYCVYVHLNNSTGYVGSGNLKRPYDMSSSNRGNNWHEAFQTRPTIKIIKEFDNKEDAIKYELGFLNHLKDEGYALVNKQFKQSFQQFKRIY